eukprot:7216383-Karenia_brevis.AAC.1
MGAFCFKCPEWSNSSRHKPAEACTSARRTCVVAGSAARARQPTSVVAGGAARARQPTCGVAG